MKKIFQLFLFLSFVAVCSVSLAAEVLAENTEGYYTYTIRNGEAYITDCDITISGNIVIPETLGGAPVVEISKYAFEECRNITNVVIPETVTTIEEGAFEKCFKLEHIEIPDSVTTIGRSVFSYCTSLQSAVIGNGVEGLENMIFEYCKNLKEIHISPNLKYYNANTFTRCNIEKIYITDLKAWCECAHYGEINQDSTAELYLNNELVTHLEIPKDVKISAKAFKRIKIQSVYIPKGTEIGSYAFTNSGLKSVVLGSSKISSYAFAANSLQYVFFTEVPKSIDRDAFLHSSVQHLLIAGSEEDWNSVSISEYNDGLLAATIHFNSDGSEIVKLGDCGYFCTLCNSFLDPSSNHSWDSGTITKSPTCTEAGIKTYTCTNCGTTKMETLAKLSNHSYDDGTITKEASCTKSGEKIYTCSICGASKTETIAAKGHNYCGIDTAPTCTAQGYTTYTCTRCNDTYKDDYVNAKGHTEVADKAVEATCTTTGLTGGKHCSVCDEVLTAQNIIPAKGHTDADTNYLCDTCGRKLCANHTEETIPGTAATCLTDGLTDGKKCVNCGEIIKAQEVITATGHSYSEWKQIKAPTTEETGLEERVCACGAKEQREIDKLEPASTEPQPSDTWPTTPATKPSTTGNAKKDTQENGGNAIIIAVVAALGGLGIGGAAMLIVLKKKK